MSGLGTNSQTKMNGYHYNVLMWIEIQIWVCVCFAFENITVSSVYSVQVSNYQKKLFKS